MKEPTKFPSVVVAWFLVVLEEKRQRENSGLWWSDGGGGGGGRRVVAGLSPTCGPSERHTRGDIMRRKSEGHRERETVMVF